MDGIDSKKSSLPVNEENNENANTLGTNSKSPNKRDSSTKGTDGKRPRKQASEKVDTDEAAGNGRDEKGGAKNTGAKNSD